MAKLLYTMGEVAERLGESTSAVRYWSNYFEKFIKPSRVKKQGMTLDGAMARLTEDRRSVEKRVKALNSLKEIRASLQEVRKSL